MSGASTMVVKSPIKLFIASSTENREILQEVVGMRSSTGIVTFASGALVNMSANIGLPLKGLSNERTDDFIIVASP